MFRDFLRPKILKDVSLKTKVYIMIALCIIGAVIVVMAAIQNRKAEEPKTTQENAAKIILDSGENANAKEKSEQEKEKKNEADEKQKALEDKFDKGYAAFQNKSYLEAVNLEEEVIKEDPTFYKAYNVAGIALCYSGKYQDGMTSIDKALSMKPDYGYGRFNKALAYELYGHYDEALQWYDKALEVENFVWSHYGIASIYGRRGDVANTVKNLKIAIDMQQNVKEEAKKEPDFNPVKDSKEFQDLVK